MAMLVCCSSFLQFHMERIHLCWEDERSSVHRSTRRASRDLAREHGWGSKPKRPFFLVGSMKAISTCSVFVSSFSAVWVVFSCLNYAGLVEIPTAYHEMYLSILTNINIYIYYILYIIYIYIIYIYIAIVYIYRHSIKPLRCCSVQWRTAHMPRSCGWWLLGFPRWELHSSLGSEDLKPGDRIGMNWACEKCEKMWKNVKITDPHDFGEPPWRNCFGYHAASTLFVIEMFRSREHCLKKSYSCGLKTLSLFPGRKRDFCNQQAWHMLAVCQSYQELIYPWVI